MEFADISATWKTQEEEEESVNPAPPYTDAYKGSRLSSILLSSM